MIGPQGSLKLQAQAAQASSQKRSPNTAHQLAEELCPRGLWLDLVGLGAVPAVGERCLWLLFSKHEIDPVTSTPALLGAMGGHVTSTGSATTSRLNGLRSAKRSTAQRLPMGNDQTTIVSPCWNRPQHHRPG